MCGTVAFSVGWSSRRKSRRRSSIVHSEAQLLAQGGFIGLDAGESVRQFRTAASQGRDGMNEARQELRLAGQKIDGASEIESGHDFSKISPAQNQPGLLALLTDSPSSPP